MRGAVVRVGEKFRVVFVKSFEATVRFGGSTSTLMGDSHLNTHSFTVLLSLLSSAEIAEWIR